MEFPKRTAFFIGSFAFVHFLCPSIVYLVIASISRDFARNYEIQPYIHYLGCVIVKTVQIILELIGKNGLNQSTFCKNVGLSSGQLSDWKSGRSAPGNKSLLKIADYFGVTTDYLLNGTDSNHPEYDVTLDDFSYAMLEESGPLSDKDKQTLLDMARLMRKRQHEEGKDKA